MSKAIECENLTIFPIAFKKDGTERLTKNGEKMISWKALFKFYPMKIKYLGFELDCHIEEIVKGKTKSGNDKTEYIVSSKRFGMRVKVGQSSLKSGKYIAKIVDEAILKAENEFKKEVKESWNKSYDLIVYSPLETYKFMTRISETGAKQLYGDFTGTFKNIKQAYRKWTKLVHPDMGCDNPLLFQFVTEVYEDAMRKRRSLVDILRANGVDMEY